MRKVVKPIRVFDKHAEFSHQVGFLEVDGERGIRLRHKKRIGA